MEDPMSKQNKQERARKDAEAASERVRLALLDVERANKACEASDDALDKLLSRLAAVQSVAAEANGIYAKANSEIEAINDAIGDVELRHADALAVVRESIAAVAEAQRMAEETAEKIGMMVAAVAHVSEPQDAEPPQVKEGA
jgi:septation ring formation regulator EzrA